MRTLIILFSLIPSIASAGVLPFSGTYGSDTFCSQKPGGIALSDQRLFTSETLCGAPQKNTSGFVVKCDIGPDQIAFTLTKQADGSFLYSDDYWGKEVLHACR